MSPQSFIGSCTIEDQMKFMGELKKVFDVMHVADNGRVELVCISTKKYCWDLVLSV